MPMSPRLLRPRSTFDPRNIANLVYWLDAGDSSTVTTVSGAVSSWASKVGSGTATQGSANNRPAYTTAGRNGRNVLTFDGTSDYLTTSTLSISQPLTIFWVGSNDNDSAVGVAPARGPYVCDGSTNTTRVAMAWNPNANVANNGNFLMFAGTVLESGAGTTFAYNKWSVISAVFNGSSSRFRTDGVQRSAGNAGANNITALVLGETWAIGGALTAFKGLFGGFLIYNRALSNAECLRVERYLAGLYAVTLA